MGPSAPLVLAALLDAASAGTRNVTATLLAETDAIAPGRPLVVGLQLRMAPQWHTYWKNPGDAGLATRVQWQLPAGFVAGALQWPRPERMPSDPLMSYGYETEVLLPTEIRTPATIAARDVTITARVSWLECREACLPGKATLELTLPVSAAPRPSPHAASFLRARERMPRPPAGLKLDAVARGEQIVLAVAGAPAAKSGYFFADTPDVVEHGAAQKLVRDAAGFRLTLEKPPNAPAPKELAGVLELDGQAYEIRITLRIEGAGGRK